MKTAGFKLNREKYFAVGEIVELSEKLRLRLSDRTESFTPTHMKAVEVKHAVYASCAGCCLSALNPGYPTCEDVALCRPETRRDNAEVRFEFCDKTGEPK